MDKVGILWDVMDDLHASRFKFVVPLRLDWADEVDEVKFTSTEAADIFPHRDDTRLSCVEMTGVEFDEVRFIRRFGASLAQCVERRRVHLQKLEAAVVREDACALSFEFSGSGGIGHADFLRTRGGVAD